MAPFSKKLRLIFCVSLFVIFFLFLISFALLVFFFVYFNGPKDNVSRSNIYQVNELRINENEAHTGIVQWGLGQRKISDDEFLQYRSEETGSYFVISEFGQQKYKCFGTCECELSERRTSFLPSLSKSLFIVFSAVSLSLALKIAEDTFRKECLSEFSNCDTKTSDIKADVEKCVIIDDMEEVPDKYKNKKLRSYQCTGDCLENMEYEDPHRNYPEEALIAQYEEFEIGAICPNYKYVNMINVICDGFSDEVCLRAARKEFMWKHFDPFCRIAAEFEYFVPVSENRKRKEIGYGCVGTYTDESAHNINCWEEFVPKYRPGKDKYYRDYYFGDT